MKAAQGEKPVAGGKSGHFEATPGATTKAEFTIAATLIDAQAVLDPWAWGHVQLYLMCGLLYMCSTMTGKSYYRAYP